VILAGDLPTHPDSLDERVSLKGVIVQCVSKLGFLSAEGLHDAVCLGRAQLGLGMGVGLQGKKANQEGRGVKDELLQGCIHFLKNLKDFSRKISNSSDARRKGCCCQASWSKALNLSFQLQISLQLV